MKTKILLGTLVVLSVLSQSCEELKPEGPKYLKEISPSIADATLTKASLDPESGKYEWEEGDAILISNGKETSVFNYAGAGKFVSENPTFEATETYKALYPAEIYDQTNSTVDEFAVVVPASQHFDGKVSSSILYSEFTNADIVTMQNLCATIAIPSSAEKMVKSVTLTSSNAKLAGPATIKKGALGISITSDVTSISAEFTSSTPSQTVYFTLPARFYVGNMRLLLTYADGETSEMYCEESFSLRANHITLQEFLEPEKVFEAGCGSPEDPYIIKSVNQYANFTNAINSPESYEFYSKAYFKLSSDIDLAELEQSAIAQDINKPFMGGFDGAGFTISNLKISSTAEAACGMFAYTDGAKITNLKLKDANISSDYVFTGSVVGHALNTSIENVEFSGNVRSYISKLTVPQAEYAPVESANAGYCGGVVGLLSKSTLKNVKFEGSASFYGKFSGGIVGCSYNSVIDNCSISKESSVNVTYHYGGGIVGRALGADNVINACSFEAPYTSLGYCNGGIVGQLLGGKVSNCVQGSYSYVGADKFFVGGIVGAAQPLENIEISYCASYGTVRGQYSIGGIVGYSGSGSGASSDKDLMLSAKGNVTIKACAFDGISITSTGANSSGYAIVGGIVGWGHIDGDGKTTVQSCYSRSALLQTSYKSNKNAVLCGISSYQNGTSALIENCYSAMTVNDFLVRGEQASANEALWYAGVHIRCTKATEVKNCFSESSMRLSYSSAAATESGCESFTQEDFKNGSLLSKLNNTTTEGVVWEADAQGRPSIKGLPADPNPKPQGVKKVSVIGDSISTFRGFTPSGYSTHYPATDGTLISVDETYWHRLIYDYMKNAELDVNIAFSGSTVTNTTEENYAKKYDTASPQAWWHNSFVERFEDCGGMGNPDIILVHGGTNDWAHNVDPLAPGIAIRPDSTNPYGGEAPSETVMSGIFATADNAKTRSDINNLPDATFCEAFTKLMCQIRERHPQAKVVCIIGDYLNTAVEKSILLIAEHYGAKTVNLLRVNGFNDLGGYDENSFSNKGTQPNMPKHDYAGDVGGCHPGSLGMDFIANKIYTELGSWLEE